MIQKIKQNKKEEIEGPCIQGSEEGLDDSSQSKSSPSMKELPEISPYRFRKDVCYKFFLRQFKNHYLKKMTSFDRKNKNKKERISILKN